MLVFTIAPAQHSGTTYIDSIKSPAQCVSIYKVSLVLQSFQVSKSIIHTLKCYNDSNAEVKVIVPRETNGPIGKPYTFTGFTRLLIHLRGL